MPEVPRRFGRAGRRTVMNAGHQVDQILDVAQAKVFRLLWLFLPEPAVARDLRLQHLLASRFLSDAAQQSLSFGALVGVARGGGSALEVALVGVAALVPPAVFGLYGGAVADALPKRAALAGAYGLQAVACLSIPAVLGTDLLTVLLLVFLVNALGQVSAPTESCVLPLVATEAELASAASMINLAAAAGTGTGTAVLAPVIVRAWGLDVVFYVAGALLLLAASRVFDLPVGERRGPIHLPPLRARLRPAVRWLVRHPAVGTMIVVAVLAATVNQVLQTLAPSYVRQVLGADPADTAYVFAPSAAGVVVALLLAPTIMQLRGERVAALFGLLVAASCVFLLGVVTDVGKVADAVNPIRLLEVVGLRLAPELRTAAFLAMPLAFGVSLTAISVQVYINRRVPIGYQGRVFAMQGVVRSGASVVPLLTLGAAASRFGAEQVLLVSPALLLVLGYGLVYTSFRFAGLAPPSGLRVMETFWEEPEITAQRARPPSG